MRYASLAVTAQFNGARANAADQLKTGFLRGVRFINSVKLIEGDPGPEIGLPLSLARNRRRQNRILSLAWLNIGVEADAKVLPKHQVSTDAEHEAAETGCRGTNIAGRCSGTRASQAGSGVDTGVRLGLGGAKTHIEIEGALSAGKLDTEEGQNQQGKVTANACHVRSLL